MDNGGGGAEVRQSGSALVVNEVGAARSWVFGAAGMRSINFYGGNGHDRFVNHTGINSAAWGYGGNDTLVGGAGNDYLDGGIGHDRVNGRGGTDNLLGGAGDDVIISIDGGTTDYIDPWTGRDVIWVDRNGSSTDRIESGRVGADDVVQQVSGFANGADRTLDGDRITDPALVTMDGNGNPTGYAYRRFEGNPLFGTLGPRATDVVQGNLGDCWLVAGAAAVAQGNPHVIQQRMVDFDDGTYGVALGAKFYRVDNDLQVVGAGSAVPAFAQLGAQNSMWVAIMEKAYAHFRTGANTYQSLNGGFGVQSLAGITGVSSSDKYFNTYVSGRAILDDIAAKVSAGNAVTLGFDVVAAGCPCVAQHEYSVVRVNFDAFGRAVSVTIRNPWGTDQGIVGSVDGNDDGFVTVTGTQLFNSAGSIAWARVV
jgi:hypothetical protein